MSDRHAVSVKVWAYLCSPPICRLQRTARAGKKHQCTTQPADRGKRKPTKPVHLCQQSRHCQGMIEVKSIAGPGKKGVKKAKYDHALGCSAHGIGGAVSHKRSWALDCKPCVNARCAAEGTCPERPSREDHCGCGRDIPQKNARRRAGCYNLRLRHLRVS